MKPSLMIFLSMGALLSAGCAAGERIGTASAAPSVPTTTGARLDAATPAERAWERAGSAALRTGLGVPASFRERLRFPADAPHAVAYRFELFRGQTLVVSIEDVGGDGTLTADVFERITDRMFRHVHAARTPVREVTYTATFDGTHVLRLQPRMGSGGIYDVTVHGEALPFPVEGGDLADVGSVFGDPRDAGARAHEGIDIFAPRGTPVVAVAAGRVTDVRSTPAGGRIVWLADAARNVSYYYAHLDEQLVRRGDHVQAGDVIGTVGNSGNARGISPHLHFGVYATGTVALDPAPLLAVNGLAGAPAGRGGSDWTVLGRWSRVAGDGVRLRRMPSVAGAIVAELRAGTPLLVLGLSDGWHRVLLEDGTAGFIAAQYTAPATIGSH
jgi:peptidoglycan LD-endopeptidase LytH